MILDILYRPNTNKGTKICLMQTVWIIIIFVIQTASLLGQRQSMCLTMVSLIQGPLTRCTVLFFIQSLIMILRRYLGKTFNLRLKHDCFPVLLTVCIHPFIHEANHKVKIARPYKTAVHNTKHLSTWYICSAIFKREERWTFFKNIFL